MWVDGQRWFLFVRPSIRFANRAIRIEFWNEFLWILVNLNEREFFENHSEWVFVNMVFNIHCFTPFGVRGSLNKLQHSSFILFFTAFGTVSDYGFTYFIQKPRFYINRVIFINPDSFRPKIVIFWTKNGHFWYQYDDFRLKIVPLFLFHFVSKLDHFRQKIMIFDLNSVSIDWNWVVFEQKSELI